jgi:hypothetical protein
VTTWLVSNPQIGKGYGTRLMDDDQVQDYLAEYFATSDRIADGTELIIRKADYMRTNGDFTIHGCTTGRIPRQGVQVGDGNTQVNYF